MLTSVYNNADDKDTADATYDANDIDDADNYNRVISIALLEADVKGRLLMIQAQQICQDTVAIGSHYTNRGKGFA